MSNLVQTCSGTGGRSLTQWRD